MQIEINIGFENNNAPNTFVNCRSNEESYSRGVLSDQSYERGKKRSLVSLKMCVISWLIELAGGIFAVSFVTLHNLGFHNLHYPDCIVTFVIIPLVHLMNDEETKTVISEEGWYQGLRHMLGIYVRVSPQQPGNRQQP